VKYDADRVGITVVQLKSLRLISSNPNIGLGELAEKIKLTNSTVSGVIDRLVQHELVERVIPPENRRSVLIHLTDKGKGILNHFESNSLVIKKMNQLLEMPKEEIAHLLQLHQNILAILNFEEETS
jgi:DNA-binding MarR family transcriptional regulator